MGIGDLGSANNFVQRCIRLCVPDVVEYTPLEKKRLLQDRSYLGPECLLRYIANIYAINEDPSLVNVVKPHDEVYQS